MPAINSDDTSVTSHEPIGFQFTVENQEATDSSMWVRWCLTPEGAEYFRKTGLNPKVVIVVSVPEEANLEQRFVVPVERCMHRIWIRRPGKNIVHAFLAWSGKFDRKAGRAVDDEYKIENYFLSRADKEYKYCIVNYSGDRINERQVLPFNNMYHDFFKPVTVEVRVDERLFAPPPPAWERSWLNRYGWFHKPADQCRYRRMRLIGHPLIPILFLLESISKWVTGLVLLLFGLSLGASDLNLKALLKPWRYPCNGVLMDAPDLTDWFFGRSLWRFCLSPLLLGVNSLLLLWARHGLGEPAALLKPGVTPTLLITAADLLIVGPLLWLTVLYLISLAVIVISTFADSVNKRKQLKNKHKREEVPLPRFAEVEAAVCTDLRAEPVTLDILPKKQRTVYLRFLATKGKVCKSYPL